MRLKRLEQQSSSNNPSIPPPPPSDLSYSLVSAKQTEPLPGWSSLQWCHLKLKLSFPSNQSHEYQHIILVPRVTLCLMFCCPKKDPDCPMNFLVFTQAEVKDVAPLRFRQPVQCSDQAISCACTQEKRPVCLWGGWVSCLRASNLIYSRCLAGYDMLNETMHIQHIIWSRFAGQPPSKYSAGVVGSSNKKQTVQILSVFYCLYWRVESLSVHQLVGVWPSNNVARSEINIQAFFFFSSSFAMSLIFVV